jgi:hypothetical protein
MPEDLNPQHHRWSEQFGNALRVLSSSGIHLIRETFHTDGRLFQPYEEPVHTHAEQSSRTNVYRVYWGLERQVFQNNVLTCMSKSESSTGKVLSEMSFQLLIFPCGEVLS